MSDASPSQAEPAARVWAAMQALVTANDRRDELREAFDFGRGTGRVAVLLKLTEGPLTLREVAESQGVDAPYATVIIDKLEDRGLARRTPHPEDHRRKLVSLTEAGWRAAEIARAIKARPPEAIRRLPPEDLAALERILLAVEGAQAKGSAKGSAGAGRSGVDASSSIQAP